MLILHYKKHCKTIFLKNYIRYLLYKLYHNHYVYHNIIGTTLLYCDALPLLYKNGFTFLAEIGTGDFSIPAIAIKASFLGNKIKYIGLDQRDSKLMGLNNFLRNIGIEYDIYRESFDITNSFLKKYSDDKGILCFEHSLDDLIIDKLVPHIGLSDETEWDNIVLKCNNYIDYYVNYKLVSHYSEQLFNLISEIMNNRKLIVIIHHYLRPFCDENSFLRNLDRNIVSCINNFIEGRNLYHVTFRPNYFNEVFWIGGY